MIGGLTGWIDEGFKIARPGRESAGPALAREA
jgi:hypothetical protein